MKRLPPGYLLVSVADDNARSHLMFPKPSRKRDRELLDRVKLYPCSVCGKNGPNDPSHLRSRGAGGPDEDWNVVSMCRDHHNEWHRKGVTTFLKEHPSFWALLNSMGWLIEGTAGGETLFHPKLYGPVCDGCGALGGDCYCGGIQS